MLVTGFALLVAFELGWFDSAERAKARRAMAAAIDVPELTPCLGLASPFSSTVALRAVLAKIPPESPAVVYLAVEDLSEEIERNSARPRIRTRPADWLGKYGAVLLDDTGLVTRLTPEQWRAVATPAVPVEPSFGMSKSREDWITLNDRIRPNLALPFRVSAEPTTDQRFVAILMVDGHISSSSSLPGMGQTKTARGECYVQVHRQSDGQAVGPLFHLVGARDAGFYVHGAWIIDGKWMLWYESEFRAVWAIRFDWDVESAKLDAAPASPLLTPK